MEMGAGTFHPATTLRALGPEALERRLRAAVAPPDGRPLWREPQPAAALLPVPGDPEAVAGRHSQELYLGSLEAIGIDPALHDIRFVEDDWESPTLGAWGLGWEVWCDGMEVTQFTYFQQVGGIEGDPVSGEITYGLERLAMYLFDKTTIYDLPFNRTDSEVPLTYGDVFLQNEQEQSTYNFEVADTEMLFRHFADAEKECGRLIEQEAAAAGLRPVHQGHALLQPAGCARRDQRDRAAELHRARARPGQGVLRGLARDADGSRTGSARCG